MRVAFCGLGIMGSRMAANLVKAGHELTVWNRTRATADAWAAGHRASVAATPAEAAARADVVITMVVDGPQVAQVLLGEDGAAAGAAPGTTFVDMTTIAPGESRAIGAALTERGLRFLDAPVTGSSPRAEAGTLTIMCGGAADDLERVRPLLEAMGTTIVHAGTEHGAGELVKVINNAVAAANAATLAQALVVGEAAGADLDALVEVLRAGSGGSVMAELKAGPMRAHDWTTLFKTEHMLKDVRLAIEAAQDAGAPFPAAGMARDLLVATVGRGLGDADFAALLEAVEGLAGVALADVDVG